MRSSQLLVLCVAVIVLLSCEVGPAAAVPAEPNMFPKMAEILLKPGRFGRSPKGSSKCKGSGSSKSNKCKSG